MRPRAIDCWLNVPVGFTDYRPEFLVRVARDYFKREEEIFQPAPLPELLRQMDEAGVERAIITIDASNPEPFDEIVRAFPGKFLPSAVADPLQGMETLRLIERLATKHALGLVRIIPFMVNRPPNDKAYYPGDRKAQHARPPAAERQGLLSGAPPVHRARAPLPRPPRHPRPADAGGAAAAAPPGRGLSLL